MKIFLPILLTLAMLGLLGCASIPSGKTDSAIELLRLREPGTKWNSNSLVKGDLDGDGKDDYAAGGVQGKTYVVGIVQGPAGPSSRHWTLEFPMEGGSDEALCSTKVALKLEEIKDEDRPGLGIDLHDDRCDAFHIYWNAEEKKYDWWRL